MGLLLSRLLIILNDENPLSTNYAIAKILLDHFFEITKLSIGETADLCGVSKSTLSKFVRTIGFEDYFDFREAAYFKENRFHNPYNYNANIMRCLESHSAEEYLDLVSADITQCKQSLDFSRLERLASDIASYQHVASFGLLFSGLAAFDLQMKLAYAGKFITTKLHDTKQDEYISQAREDTLIIIFSNSGNYMNKHQLSYMGIPKDFSKTKAKIALITSNKEMVSHPKVDLCITFTPLTEVQTHYSIFPLINDLITFHYRRQANRG